jgi:superfamily I DNA/RNA helicase
MQDPRTVLLNRLDQLAHQNLSKKQFEIYELVDFTTSSIISAGAGSGKTRLASYLISKARLRENIEGHARVMTMSRTAKIEVFERATALESKMACEQIRLPPMPISHFQTIHAIGLKSEHEHLRAKFGDNYEMNVIFKKDLCELLKNELKQAEEAQGFSETSFHPLTSMSVDADAAAAAATAAERAERDVVSSMDSNSAADLLYSLRSERLKTCEPVINSSFGRTAELALQGLQQKMSGDTPGAGGIHIALVDFDAMVANLASSGIPVATDGDVLFVDEAQDLSLCQTRIVLNAMSAGACVVILGDESQGIFGFSGAMTNTLTEIKKRAGQNGININNYQLYRNHRSTDTIVACAEKFLPSEEREKRLGITGNGEFQTPIEIACCDDEAVEVARKLVAVLKDGAHPGQIAVLRHKAFYHGDELDNALRFEADRAKLDKKLLTKSIFGVNVMNSHAMKLCAVLRMALGLEHFAEAPDDAIHLLKDFLKSCGNAKTTTAMALKAIDSVWDECRCEPFELFSMHHTKLKAAFARMERMENVKNPPKRQKSADGDSQKMKNFVATIEVAASAIKACERAVNAWSVNKPLITSGQSQLSFQSSKASTLADLVRHLSKNVVIKEVENETTWLISELERKLHGQRTKDTLVDAVTSIVAEKVSKETEGKLLFSTIHRFKGKERPIVFLLGCTAPFSKPNWPQRANLHSLHNAGCSNRCGMALECGCARFQAGIAAIVEDMDVEKDRLLYVGATRAQTKLFLSVRSDAPPHPALLEMIPEVQSKRNKWTRWSPAEE